MYSWNNASSHTGVQTGPLDVENDKKTHQSPIAHKLDTLPTELCLMINEYLEIPSLISLASTNRRFRSIVGRGLHNTMRRNRFQSFEVWCMMERDDSSSEKTMLACAECRDFHAIRFFEPLQIEVDGRKRVCMGQRRLLKLAPSWYWTWSENISQHARFYGEFRLIRRCTCGCETSGDLMIVGPAGGIGPLRKSTDHILNLPCYTYNPIRLRGPYTSDDFIAHNFDFSLNWEHADAMNGRTAVRLVLRYRWTIQLDIFKGIGPCSLEDLIFEIKHKVLDSLQLCPHLCLSDEVILHKIIVTCNTFATMMVCDSCGTCLNFMMLAPGIEWIVFSSRLHDWHLGRRLLILVSRPITTDISPANDAWIAQTIDTVAQVEREEAVLSKMGEHFNYNVELH